MSAVMSVESALHSLIAMAIQEDLPSGDAATDHLGVASRHGSAQLRAKSDLFLSGSEVFTAVVTQLDPAANVEWLFQDGSQVLSGQTLAWIHGDLIQLLKSERTALNFLQRLSGVATWTARHVQALRGTPCKLVDTRKTTPGFRALEKKAVRDGGGANHRASLSDLAMLKDNHIALLGGMRSAVGALRAQGVSPLAVECANIDQVREAVELDVQRIMLDNMSLEQMSEARKLVPRHIVLEATGNMTWERLPSVARIGVDEISMGALTHSAPAADISLLFHW